MTTIERLKQGCEKVTKRWNCDYEAIWVCGKKRNGNLYLCKECRAKLSQHIETRKEDVEEFKKKISDFKSIIKNCGNLKVIEYFDKTENEYKTFWVGDEPYINVVLSLIEEELKSSLDDRDTEEKVSHIVKKDDDEVENE